MRVLISGLFFIIFSVSCTKTDTGNNANSTPVAQSPQVSIPVVNTTLPSTITMSSVLAGGEVVNEGGASVSERGVVYSVNQSPTISSGNLISNGSGTGIFSSNISGLSSGTQYYIRAYAKNKAGTGYGTEMNFLTKYCFNVGFSEFLQPNVKEIISTKSNGYYIVGDIYFANSNKRILKLNTDGTPDLKFDVGLTSGLIFRGGEGDVYSVTEQSDEKVIVVGGFNIFKQSDAIRIVRINPDGTIDKTFVTGSGFDGRVYSVVALQNGKIMVAGTFKNYNGNSIGSLVRLNSDGTIDNTFNVLNNPINYSSFSYSSEKIAVSPFDGKLYVFSGGKFYRIDQNGLIDPTFSVIPFSINLGITTFSFQPDGKIFVGTQRYFNDGKIDDSFKLNQGVSGFDAGRITAIAAQADGKVLIGGDFIKYNGIFFNGIVRFNSDGTIDNTFNVGSGLSNSGGSFYVSNFLVEKNSIIVTGYFRRYNNISKVGLVRLNMDGTVCN